MVEGWDWVFRCGVKEFEWEDFEEDFEGEGEGEEEGVGSEVVRVEVMLLWMMFWVLEYLWIIFFYVNMFLVSCW